MKSPLDWEFIQILWLFLSQVFSKAFAGVETDGLGLKQIVLLAVLEKPQWPLELRRVLGVPASTMSNMINDLEKRGLAMRSIDPTDKRRFQVQRTTSGNVALEAAVKQVQAVLDDYSSRVPADDVIWLVEAKRALTRIVLAPDQVSS